MRVVFVPREGTDLYSTLLASETSREALRFYQPERTPAGVAVTVATLGSALSLVSDLRWYVRRYMHGVIVEIAPGTFCTANVARRIYEKREPIPREGWRYRRVYTFADGKLVGDEPLRDGGDCAVQEGAYSLEVWCTEEEYTGEKMER
ncbi:MAG: DUF5804 family protein [Methanolinea sp.]|nr:DUF5804 family protein [Methanolinea sp.]